MPFRRPKYLAALIRALGALCAALLLQACAVTEDSARPADTAAPDARGEIWQVIDGGLLDSRLVAGPIDIRLVQPVAVAARGHLVYILDAGLRQLLVYDSQIDRMRVLKDLRGIVQGDSGALFLARDLSLYVADSAGGRVLQFDPEGKQLRILQDRINLGRPVAISVNEATGYIFVADGFNDHVLAFTPEGQLEAAIGGRGQEPGRFLGITALAEGPRGFYIGSRFGADRVQILGNDGLYADAFQRDTVTFPTAIAVQSDGLAFVSDYLSDQIEVYNGIQHVGTIGGHGGAPGRFRRITGLWLDEGFLYVADSLNRRIQVLTLASWELSRPQQ